MKRIAAIILLLLMGWTLLPKQAAAMPVPCNHPSANSYPEYYTLCVYGGGGGSSGGSSQDVYTKYYYVPYLDQYRVDYTKISAARYRLEYTSPGGTVYTKDYNFAPTGVHYLTCNGSYNMKFYNSSGQIISESTPTINTTQIANPLCDSYADGGQTGQDDLQATQTADGITWNQMPGAESYEVWKDGQKVDETTGTTTSVDGPGSITIVAKDGAGNVIGQSDMNLGSSGGGCGDVCQKLAQLLACPDWDDYMGEWTNAIKAALPPPPDWEHVAEIMRDKIVPAMGQEIVNRSPEIAEILADEFESREKPVSSPPPLPTFAPDVPKMIDLPQKIDNNLTDDIPSFEPDFSGSQSFEIPDPMDVTLDNTDKGYGYPTQQDLSAPTYQRKSDVIEPDKGYQGQQPDVIAPPAYEVKNTTNNKPIPSYQPRPAGTPPPYHMQESGNADYQIGSKSGDPPPEYGRTE